MSTLPGGVTLDVVEIMPCPGTEYMDKSPVVVRNRKIG